MRAHRVAIDLVCGRPRHCLGIRAGDGLADLRPADEVDNDEVITDASFSIAVYAIERLDDRTHFDVQPGFFEDLSPGAVRQRLTELQESAGKRPLPFARFVTALHDQRACAANDHRADADDGSGRVFSGHMQSHTEYLTFNIKGRVGFENITQHVATAVRKSGVKEGLVLVNAMHITASVFINDDERGLHQDYAKWLETLAPFDASPQRYAHNRTGEDNADAHMKRQIMGREVVVAITDGQLDFGPWEQIFYGEFDGNRNKRVLIKVVGE